MSKVTVLEHAKCSYKILNCARACQDWIWKVIETCKNVPVDYGIPESLGGLNLLNLGYL
jgi:hypothetical protein